MKGIKIYSPATIANIVCGFDVLGLALNEPVDEMIFRKSKNPGVHICNIKGAHLSKQPDKNVVGVVLKKLLQNIPNNKLGIEVDILKNIIPGSGIGSSAASAAGAAFGANILFGNYFNNSDLLKFSIEGEKFACGTPHADNVTPALFGGVTLIKNNDIVLLPYPKNLWATIIHPQIEIKTSEARKILKETITFKNAILQWGNVGALVSAFYRKDNRLIGKCLEDFIIERIRSYYIPAFFTLKIKCKKAGALGGGISGSGPSVFMFSENKKIATKVSECMSNIYNKLNIQYKIYLSTINNIGIKTEIIY